MPSQRTQDDDQETQYTAISYAWGDPEACCCIYVNGKKFRIARNAFELLKSIRTFDKDLVIWIDAICINQRDAAEKGHQVQSMASIFCHAKEVLAWLGPAFDGSDRLLVSFTGILDRSKRSVETGKSSSHLETDRTEKDSFYAKEAAKLSPADIAAFYGLISQAWFTRLWILPEMALGKNVVLRCGDICIPFVSFKVSSRVYRWSLPSSRMGTLDLMFQLQHTVRKAVTEKSPLSLPLVAHECRNGCASNPQDYVYGTLGMIYYVDSVLQSSSNSLKIDYELPCSEVYARATCWCFERDANLDILSLRHTESVAQCFGVGSRNSTWVRNFSALSGASFGLEVSHREAFGSSGIQNANYGINKDFWVDLDSSLLVAKGISEDEVVQIAPEYTADGDDFIMWIQIMLHFLIDWGLEGDARWVLLCADLWYLPNKDRRSYHSNRERYYTVFKNLVFSNPTYHGLNYREVLKEVAKNASAKGDERFITSYVLGSLYLASKRRRLAMTRADRVAWIPNDCQPGDLIYILRGGRVPYVLRPVPSRGKDAYEFVGECWVDGLMHGEAADWEGVNTKYVKIY